LNVADALFTYQSYIKLLERNTLSQKATKLQTKWKQKGQKTNKKWKFN